MFRHPSCCLTGAGAMSSTVKKNFRMFDPPIDHLEI